MMDELDKQIRRTKRAIAKAEVTISQKSKELRELLREKYRDCKCCKLANKTSTYKFGIASFLCPVRCGCHHVSLS